MARDFVAVPAKGPLAAIGAGLTSRAKGVGKFCRRKPLGAVGLVIVGFMILLAATVWVGGWLGVQVTPYDPLEMTTEFLQPPSLDHPFGTDKGGRDMLSRVMGGAKVSVYVGFLSIIAASLGGALLGIPAAIVGGKFDLIVMRFVDIKLAFPSLVLALAIMAALGQSLNNVVIAIAISQWPRFTRILRSAAIQIRETQYIESAWAIGCSRLRVMIVHVLPNTMAPYLIIATALLGHAIVTEATLSFLGLGVPPPHPSWGRMLSGAAREFAESAPWMVIFPGLILAIVVYGFNVLGDALRDVWDPRLRGT